MTILEGQMVACMAQIMYWHASITSGAYRHRDVSQGCGRNEDGTTQFRPLTDEEKLDDSMKTLQRHVHRIWDLVDHLPEKTDDQTR